MSIDDESSNELLTDPDLADVAAAILDGRLVDWNAVASRTPSSRREDLQQLRLLADLASVSAEITLSPGDWLFVQGAAHDRHFLVVDGEVETARRDPEVRRRYGPGDLVTSAAALANRARDWGARARTAARLLAIPHEAWFDLMEEHFELVDSTLAMLATEREALLEVLAASAGPDGLVLT